MKEFFENRNLIAIIDDLSKRYGKLPHEVFFETTIYEFCFDVAVMVIGRFEQAEAAKLEAAKRSQKVDWGKKGFQRVVKKKKKGD